MEIGGYEDEEEERKKIDLADGGDAVLNGARRASPKRSPHPRARADGTVPAAAVSAGTPGFSVGVLERPLRSRH
jgi:hypothetical protein